MFSELDNIDVLFRLSGSPRIALLTARATQDFLFQFVKIKVNVVAVVGLVF